jgi:hypothetical protein
LRVSSLKNKEENALGADFMSVPDVLGEALDMKSNMRIACF